jgi:CRP-like cAMP-binding protein
MTNQKLVDKALLKTLVPPSALNPENFQELAGKAVVEEIALGNTIFKQGEKDGKVVYLLEGEVNLFSNKGQETVIRSGTDIAKHPLANQQPRQRTATAKTPCKITRFYSSLLDILLTWDQMAGIEVDELQQENKEASDDGDWMTRILQSKAFLQVPPANIHAMFMRMQEVPARAGETIIKQNDEGDYYYIIKSGKCKVTRTSKTGAQLTLAQLSEGDAFGEEALLSDAKRNANVIMVTDGFLMRLSKDDFNELLKEPVLNWVIKSEADAMIKDGAAWLDVRLESEHKNSAIEGSMNLPLFMLRLKAGGLDSSRKYIVYCDTGRRSSAAVFLLNELGIQAYILKGGLVWA